MASHNDLGRYGEQLAKHYLLERKFQVLFTNWKSGRYEIDIIAAKDEVLHFIEVKTRRSNVFGWPEESVDDKKMARLMKAAEDFLVRNAGWTLVQYDILSINIGSTGAEYFFIEDVYL